ncbi:uncharacterized protein LOC111585109 [Amphiprion ocellaris]|uniref:uncharacterized protein LOC111585109 n=1 Tax=Amphiprion ocellaris TaxID=80972 RepID=UPI00241105CC|nr:uncharacterized protein LOC111585109 [Amphiprion ocellaris]
MFERQHCFMMTKWGWTPWMILYFTVPGVLSLVTVHQPPVLTAALGGDTIMPCELQLSHDEKMVSTPVLYWHYLQQESNKRLWQPSEPYKGRVQLLDDNKKSWNKSIVLKEVQWADSGRYECKLTVTTQREGSFRKKGNLTSLAVHDSMLFNLTGHNASLLRCEVNVTQDAGFALTVLHGSCRLRSVNSASGGNVSPQPYVTLSETIAVQAGGKYECQLHLKEDLIIKSVFHNNLLEGAQTNATACSPDIPVVVGPEYPEPWLLYMALLLVPITVLLGLATAMLIRRGV